MLLQVGTEKPEAVPFLASTNPPLCRVFCCEEDEPGLLQSPFPHYPFFSHPGTPPLLMSLRHKERFVGGLNSMTGIKEAAFWDSGGSRGHSWNDAKGFVVAGSDCGHALVFDRRSLSLACALKADSDVVNCVRPHPSLPLLATSGIENTIRLWAPRYAHATQSPNSTVNSDTDNADAPKQRQIPLHGPTAPRVAARATADRTGLSRLVMRNSGAELVSESDDAASDEDASSRSRQFALFHRLLFG